MPLGEAERVGWDKSYMSGGGQWLVALAMAARLCLRHHRARIRTEACPDSGIAWHVSVPGLPHMLARGLSGGHHRRHTDPRTSKLPSRVPRRVE